MSASKEKKLGFTIREDIGVGDKVQFSSLPENYFAATGERLIDVSKAWVFDHNPYVLRDVEPNRVVELWNWPKQYEWPKINGRDVYLSNAEVWANLLNVPVVLNRPRLYRFEKFPFQNREMILFSPRGKSNGLLPEKVISHVLYKYGKTNRLFHICSPDDTINIGLPKIETPSLWQLAAVISQAQLFIGVDSGPAWIAACFPDVVVKKVRIRPVIGQREFKDWVPLEISNHHSHWDDRLFQIYCTSEDDTGFMSSYLKI